MTSQLVVSKILGKQPVTLQSSKESVRKFTEYLKKKFLSGAGISELSELRCCFVDNLLRKCADQLDLRKKIPDLALVAVGGYGRMELHPYTDIDILVVTRTPLSDDMGELVSSYITMLWDTTIDIGHSRGKVHLRLGGDLPRPGEEDLRAGLLAHEGILPGQKEGAGGAAPPLQ